MSFSRHALATVIAGDSLRGRFGKRRAEAVAAYLISSGHIHELAPLLRDVAALRLQQGRVEVVATSARTLTPTALRDIRAVVKRHYPGAKQIHITPRIDPALIGGTKLTFGEYELDLSVRARFERFSAAALGERQRVGHG